MPFPDEHVLAVIGSSPLAQMPSTCLRVGTEPMAVETGAAHLDPCGMARPPAMDLQLLAIEILMAIPLAATNRGGPSTAQFPQ